MNGGALKLDRDRLQRAREMLGYGLEKTAEEAGISKNSVLRAEHEEDIRPVTARKIAAALNVPVADLIRKSETLKAQAPPEPKVVKGSADIQVDAETFKILEELASGEISVAEAKARLDRVLEPVLQ
jgi:transcriptional regulator with XRE-family HTH domain